MSMAHHMNGKAPPRLSDDISETGHHEEPHNTSGVQLFRLNYKTTHHYGGFDSLFLRSSSRTWIIKTKLWKIQET